METTPKYKVGTIVWRRPADRFKSTDIDCKVLKVELLDESFQYKIITGNGTLLNVKETGLISRQELSLLKLENCFKLREASGGLLKGEEFYILDDWVINDRIGIFIEKNYFNEKLISLFYAVSGTSM